MSTPSVQLGQDIHDAVTRALAERQPLLHHLNADTSWLLQLPRPETATKRGGRIYYNILIDPWLAGGQSDVARWFSQQWHATESKVGSIAEVEQLARDIETLAGGVRLWKGKEMDGVEDGVDVRTFIDAVAISHEFTDHCHKETLLDVDAGVPVFATKKAYHLIKSWNHFRHVAEAHPFTTTNPDWRSTSLPPLPEWLGISRLTASKDALYYHSALLICFNTTPASPHPSFSSDSSSADAAQCLIYTPHGIPASALTPIAQASPPLQTLCFIHGLHDVSIGKSQQLNLGAHNGLAAQRVLKAKYWVGTHDEVKKGGGLVSWFLNRKILTVEEAMRQEARSRDREKKVGDELEDVRFEDLGNGESLALS